MADQEGFLRPRISLTREPYICRIHAFKIDHRMHPDTDHPQAQELLLGQGAMHHDYINIPLYGAPYDTLVIRQPLSRSGLTVLPLQLLEFVQGELQEIQQEATGDPRAMVGELGARADSIACLEVEIQRRHVQQGAGAGEGAEVLARGTEEQD